MDELGRAEVLNEALDALRDGACLEDAAAGLPEEFRGLINAVLQLEHSAKYTAAVAPSATFTLSLEEQLRTDFRLRITDVPNGLWTGWRTALVATTVLFATGAIVLLGAGFGLLSPQPADGAPLTVQDAMRRLDDGWQEIDSLRGALESGELSAAGLQLRLGLITAVFIDALDATAYIGNPRAEARVRADVTTAASTLAALANGRSDPVRDEIVDAQRQLVVRLLRTRVGSLDPAPIEFPGIIVSTPLASPIAGTEPTGVIAEPTETLPAATDTAEPIASPPTATVIPPHSTESPTSTPMPIVPDPPATTRPRPTDPPLVPPDPPSPPSPIEPPTRTPDAWPTHDPTKAPPPPIVTPSPGTEPTIPPLLPMTSPRYSGGVERNSGRR